MSKGRVVAARAAFIDQLHMHWAMLETVETEFQRVIQMTERQVLGTPPIGAIEKRTMLDVFSHDEKYRTAHAGDGDLSDFIGCFVG